MRDFKNRISLVSYLRSGRSEMGGKYHTTSERAARGSRAHRKSEVAQQTVAAGNRDRRLSLSDNRASNGSMEQDELRRS